MKTLNMTRNLLAALLLTCAAAMNALGQIEQAPATPKIDPAVLRWLASIANAPNSCIFEGEVLRSYAYEDEFYRFFSYEVRITNIFKGNLKSGTIQILKRYHKDLSVARHGGDPSPKNGIFYTRFRKDAHLIVPPPDSVWTEFDNKELISDWVFFEFREHAPKVGIDIGRIGNAGFSTRHEFFEWFKVQDYVTIPSGYDVNRLEDGKYVRPINYPPIDLEAEKREREEFNRKFKEEKRKWDELHDPNYKYYRSADSARKHEIIIRTKEQFDSLCKVNLKFERMRKLFYKTGDAGVNKTTTLEGTASISNPRLQFNDLTDQWEIQAKIGVTVSEGLYLEQMGFQLY